MGNTILSDEEIIKERKKLDIYLEHLNIKHDKRIYFSKKFLESILFDTFIDKNGNKFKRIGFISKNLHKLDLSEISFDDVSFNGEDYPNLDKKEFLNLSNTNAVIDFSKSYEYKTTGQVVITSFDLHGTNLSNNNWHDLTQKCFGFIKNSNLSGTNTRLTDEGRKVYLKFNKTDLSSNDLSDISIGYESQISKSPEIAFISCIFTKSGINIDYRGENKEIIREIVTSPIYKGCKYNGRPIKTDEEIEIIKSDAKKKIMTNPSLK